MCIRDRPYTQRLECDAGQRPVRTRRVLRDGGKRHVGYSQQGDTGLELLECLQVARMGTPVAELVDLVRELIQLRRQVLRGRRLGLGRSGWRRRWRIAGDGHRDLLRRTLLPVSYTHLRAHETPEHLVCRLL